MNTAELSPSHPTDLKAVEQTNTWTDVNSLFPPASYRRQIDNWLTDALSDARLGICDGPVAQAESLESAAAQLAGYEFDTQRSLPDVLAWVIHRMERGMVHVSHPRYFGLFNPAPTWAAQCADRIAGTFNPQLATSKTSPFPVALERHVIRAVAARAGLPPCTVGHFTSGGAEANYTALLCALTQACLDFASSGARAFTGTPVFYASRESHLAWVKIAAQAGLGRNAVRLVTTDGRGRMDAQALEAAISGDLANGSMPVMVVATAGTTGGGMIDPLVECASISRRHRLWFHVDAAWGGAVIASDRLRHTLAGIELADSVLIDAHKWFATTMGCGMFLTRHPKAVMGAFQVTMDCMPSSVPGVDPYLTSIQWSRRFVGLRLFIALASAGWGGYAHHVERSIDLANLAMLRLLGNGWVLVNQPLLAVICVAPPPGSRHAKLIAQHVVESGCAWVSAIEFEGTPAIRICVTSGETTEQDISTLVRSLITAAALSC